MLQCDEVYLVHQDNFDVRSKVLIHMVLGPRFTLPRFFAAITLIFICFAATTAQGATRRKKRVVKASGMHHRTVAATAMVARASLPRTRTSTLTATTTKAPIIRGGPWLSPTYADSTSEDFVDGEDLDVRRAAVEALGPYNGSVV